MAEVRVATHIYGPRRFSSGVEGRNLSSLQRFEGSFLVGHIIRIAMRGDFPLALKEIQNRMGACLKNGNRDNHLWRIVHAAAAICLVADGVKLAGYSASLEFYGSQTPLSDIPPVYREDFTNCLGEVHEMAENQLLHETDPKRRDDAYLGMALGYLRGNALLWHTKAILSAKKISDPETRFQILYHIATNLEDNYEKHAFDRQLEYLLLECLPAAAAPFHKVQVAQALADLAEIEEAERLLLEVEQQCGPQDGNMLILVGKIRDSLHYRR